MTKLLEFAGRPVIYALQEAGRMLFLLFSALAWMCRPPFRIRVIFAQMEFVGVHSLVIIIITGAFTGAVLALQSYYGFRMFGGESLVGSTVALAMTRELGPVFAALMVTARAGSAMAAELGAMRVNEQIDALHSMSVNPVQYLVMPRVVAGVLMLPALTVICDFVGVLGGYFVGVRVLGINSGIFVAKIIEYVGMDDIFSGLIKSMVFGLLLTLIGCYKGYYASGGAKGVGAAATQAVVLSSVCILISDYFLTAAMF
ncbi:toluene transporter subunit: membrane component of ABC superfamily [Candidatus Desulfarcum epimagneticum]|uniref:Toluene transporter subunit: membrane component of ABC superfamily n=1 Tax=uncultured Desulfobacteraceae bacterium TaxID=218296 RepID=A0A484HHL0_9BACT|nr:toluene transporter subunit: membrane component of ABC superfamily [uncultured Desulfobacteraceae bacterium]